MSDESTRRLEEFLVVGARLGDRQAAERLVAIRGPQLLSHATRLLGDREAARDVVQEAWLEIFRGLRGLRDERAFPAWAHQVVTRRAAKSIRRAQKRRELAREATQQPPPADEDAGAQVLDADRVRRAIDALPPDQKAAISLFYLQEMSVAEVAVALDASPGTIKTRLMYARAKLAKAMKGDSDEQA